MLPPVSIEFQFDAYPTELTWQMLPPVSIEFQFDAYPTELTWHVLVKD